MIRVQDNVLTVSTAALDAIIDHGVLISLKDKNGREFLSEAAKDSPALEVLYRGEEKNPIAGSVKKRVHCISLSDTCAEIRIDALDGNGVITVKEDEENGDLCIEPEVSTARRGLRAARYTIGGIAENLRVAAPLFQGVDLEMEDKLILNRRWIWPHAWEAGLCIFHDGDEGFWLYCRDREYRSKAMIIGDNRSVSVDTEAWGPVDHSLSAGGITWRINVFKGGWKVPAAKYRDWLWEAYSLRKEEQKRADWAKDIRLAIAWADVNEAAIRALAKKVDPKTVLLHIPHWRDKKYDQCYPDFTPSEDFKAFLKTANTLGFHCMPHANGIDMDPSMPEYRYVADFKYADIESGRFLGWGFVPMPHSHVSLQENRESNVMVKIHPGLAAWRSILAENIDKALAQLDYSVDSVFLDVVLCMYNLDNSLVDNTTTMQGMQRLIDHVRSIRGGLTVGGEGLNEITMQQLTFAQVHLFDYNLNGPDLARTGNCDLNNFLFGRLCRTFGYNGLSGINDDEILRGRIYAEHGAMLTITGCSADMFDNPNPEIARVLRMAAEGHG